MISENLVIVTAHPDFLDAALSELKRLDGQLKLVESLAPGIELCAATQARTLARLAAEQRPIFVRHLAPMQASMPLSNTVYDIGAIAVTLADLPAFALLERGQRFAVQSRFAQAGEQSSERAYTSGELNRQLAEAIAAETGAIESIKKPQIVVSLLCAGETAYMGISPVEENLSAWPGGARHFAHTPEQISRAEFKLLEALEVFGVTLPARGLALDLGAAPGGWTRLLLAADMHVVAVDPAQLDPRLNQQRGLELYRGYAESYITLAIRNSRRFHLIADDMRMDALNAARLLGQAAMCMRKDGFGISVLKLPHAIRQVDPASILRAALNLLRQDYAVVQARQLFHNRQEVTVLTAQPLRGGRNSSARKEVRYVT